MVDRISVSSQPAHLVPYNRHLGHSRPVYAGIVGCFWLGASLGMLVNPVDSTDSKLFVLWFSYTALLYTGALTITMGLLQAANYFMKTTFLSILVAPFYFFAIFESQLISKYLYPKTFDQALEYPNWSIVAACTAGLPLAVLCVIFGAKHLHLLLKQESSPRFSRSR